MKSLRFLGEKNIIWSKAKSSRIFLLKRKTERKEVLNISLNQFKKNNKNNKKKPKKQIQAGIKNELYKQAKDVNGIERRCCRWHVGKIRMRQIQVDGNERKKNATNNLKISLDIMCIDTLRIERGAISVPNMEFPQQNQSEPWLKSLNASPKTQIIFARSTDQTFLSQHLNTSLSKWKYS